MFDDVFMNPIKSYLAYIFLSIFISSAFAMRTPLSFVDIETSPMRTKIIEHDLEALLYRQEIMRYEQNRIFFLIEPYIETRLRMG